LYRGLLKVFRGRSKGRTDSNRSLSPARQDPSKEAKENKETSSLRRQVAGRSKLSPRDSLDEARTPVPSTEPDVDRPLDPVVRRLPATQSDGSQHDNTPSASTVPLITMSSPVDGRNSQSSSTSRRAHSPVLEEEDPVLTSTHLEPKLAPPSPVSLEVDPTLASPNTRRRRKLPTPGLSPRSSKASSLSSSPAGSISELDVAATDPGFHDASESSLERASAAPTLHALAHAFQNEAYDPITRLQLDPISEGSARSLGHFNRNKASQQSTQHYQARAAAFARRSSDDEDDSSVGTYSRRGSLLSAFSSDAGSPLGPVSLGDSRRSSIDDSFRSDSSSSSLLRQRNLSGSGDELDSLPSVDEERTRL
jgi:hypothetical protein